MQLLATLASTVREEFDGAGPRIMTGHSWQSLLLRAPQ